jgi:signal transduction histidine kinase/CheY-like chemotaxis protein
MEKINKNINNDLKILREYFNETYQSYLNNISPLIFMNDFLDKIIELTGSKSGYIMSLYNYNDASKDNFLILEAINKNIFSTNEFIVHNNNLISLEDDSIFVNVCKSGEFFLSNNFKQNELYKEPYTNITDIKTYFCYPIKFINKIIGVIGLVNANSYDNEIFVLMEELSNLLSILINNYKNNNKTNQDKRFISFQLMDEIMNKTNDGVIIINNYGEILYHNYLGIEFIKNIINDKYSKKFISKNIIDLISQFDFLVGFDDKKENKLFKNKSINLEATNHNGNILYYEISINSVLSNNIINHIMLIDKREVSSPTNKKTQNNLVAFLSHELRNPLQSLTMAIHLLQKKIEQIDKIDNKLNLYITTISKSSNEMKRIINDILDLSKVECNEMELILDNHNIDEIIDTLLLNFTNTLHEKNITIKKCIDEKCPKTIFTDLTRINQILSNLISNAIKYSEKNKEIIIKLTYEKKNHGINFDIIDQGMGISKDQFHNLFKENGKTTNSYKFDVKSNGIGLYLSQKIAHILEGHITFSSEPNIGSVFTLFHPIKLGLSINNLKNKVNANILEGKVLIVDDDESNLIMFRLLLENFKLEYNIDLEINTVQDGKSAIDICLINKYDLIFMDINMVGIDGCTATKVIKANYDKKNYKIPVIATTGNIMAKKENQNISTNGSKYLCFDDIIIKPYDEQSILSILNRYLTN